MTIQKKFLLTLLTATFIAFTACNTADETAEITPPAVTLAPLTTIPPVTTAPVEPTPSPEPPTEFAYQHLEDFLSNFLTLTGSFGFMTDDGTYRDFSSNIFEARPLVVWERLSEYPWVVYFDRLGNRLENTTCIVGEGFATDFALYYLGNNGVPDIVIRWGIPETCAAFRHLFRFIDGEYRNIGTIKGWYNFFLDPDGRLVVLYDDALNGPMAYYYLNFNGSMIEHEHLLDTADIGYEAWIDHHWSDEFRDNPYIIGTDIPLTPVLPLTELHAEIVQAIRLRHGVE